MEDDYELIFELRETIKELKSRIADLEFQAMEKDSEIMHLKIFGANNEYRNLGEDDTW